SADLIPVLRDHADVRLFAEPPAGGTAGGLEVEAPAAFDASSNLLPVYHMGNNRHHRFVAERIVERPGILVLHDLVLHHYWVEETLAEGRREEYLRLMTAVYGERGEEAGRARADEVSSQTEYFVFPLFEGLAAASA